MGAFSNRFRAFFGFEVELKIPTQLIDWANANPKQDNEKKMSYGV